MSKKPNSAVVINARAPAKINLGLRVLGRRADGYHEVVSLLAPLSLCDRLRLQTTASGIELRCPNSDLTADQNNLVYRAAQLVLQASECLAGIEIELTKEIPVAAGLGGGSSDAAATMVAANELLGRPLSHSSLQRLSSRLGADVPFFLLAGPAIAEGIGERLTSVAGLPTLWTVLASPSFQVSTRWAYENLTLTRGPNGSKFKPSRGTHSPAAATFRQCLLERPGITLEDILPLLINDFEPLVFNHYAQLAELKEALLAQGARAVLMSGSGPTLAGLFDSERMARLAYRALQSRGGARYFLAHTLGTGGPGRTR